MFQIWDFGSGEKIKDIPQDPLHKSQVKLLFIVISY